MIDPAFPATTIAKIQSIMSPTGDFTSYVPGLVFQEVAVAPATSYIYFQYDGTSSNML